MAWAEKQRSGRYAGKYRDAAQVVRSVGTFTRKAEAERRAGAKEDEVRRRPGRVDPRAGKTTWGTWGDEWWDHHHRVQAGTKNRDEPRMRLYLRPRWNRIPLQAISRADIQRWVDELHVERGGPLGSQSVVHCYHLLSKSLNDAVTAGKLEQSPCQQIELPPLPDGDDRFFTHDEVDRIAAVLPEPFRTLVLTLCGSGLRWGEAAGLHWHRINFDHGMIRVAEVHDHNTKKIKPHPKGRKLRDVYTPDWLLDELDQHRRRLPPSRSCALPHQDGRCRSGLVFPSSAGTPIGHSNFSTRYWGYAVGRWVWRRSDGREFDSPSAARRAKGVLDEPEPIWREGVARVGPARIHDTRHTYASWNLQGGEDADGLPIQPMPIHELALAMGHTDTEITRRYGHLAGAQRDRARAAGAWRGTRQPAPHLPREPHPGERETITLYRC